MPVFIYCLKDPTTGDVRYIGKTSWIKKRLKDHLKYSSKRRSHLGCWLQSLASRQEIPVLVVLHKVAENECWQEEERRYISCARALGVDLVNNTDGGEGAAGRIATPEQRAAQRGPLSPGTCAAMSAAKKGVKHSPERCAARRGVPLSPKHCAAMRVPKGHGAAVSAAMTGVPKSPEHRAALSFARIGVPWSPARRAAYERRWGTT